MASRHSPLCFPGTLSLRRWRGPLTGKRLGAVEAEGGSRSLRPYGPWAQATHCTWYPAELIPGTTTLSHCNASVDIAPRIPPAPGELASRRSGLPLAPFEARVRGLPRGPWASGYIALLATHTNCINAEATILEPWSAWEANRGIESDCIMTGNSWESTTHETRQSSVQVQPHNHCSIMQPIPTPSNFHSQRDCYCHTHTNPACP